MKPRVEHVSKAIDRWASVLRDGEKSKRENTLPTGFQALDETIGGLPLGSLTVLGGMPCAGKSAFAANIAVHSAAHRSVKTAYLSVDRSGYDILKAMVCLCASVPAYAVRRGRCSEEDRNRMADEMARLKESPLYLGDCAGLPLDDVMLELDMIYDYADMDSPDQLRLVVIDSLGGLAVGENSPGRQGEVEYFASLFRKQAQSLQVALLLLAETGMYADSWNHRRPRMSDLRHGHSLARHAGMTMLVHRPGWFDSSEGSEKAELIVAQNRSGPTGTFPLQFDRDTMRFRQAPC